MSALKHIVFRQGLIYVFFDVLNRGLPLLLLPVLLRFMNSAEYGVVANFTILTSVLSVLTGLSVHGAVNVNYFRMERSDFQEFVGNVLLVLVLSASTVMLVLVLGGEWIAQILSLELKWVVLAGVLAAAEFVTLVNLILWQAEQKARQFGSYQFCKICLDLGMTLLLVVVAGMGAEGRITAMVAASCVFAFLSLIVMYQRGYIRIGIRRSHIANVLSFGLPLIPHAMSAWIVTGLDRVWLTNLVSLSAAGIYTVGYQIATVVGLATVAFNKAYNPYVYKRLNDITYAGKIGLVRFTYLYSMLLILLALIYGFGVGALVVPMLGQEYAPAAKLVPFLAVGFAFQGMYLMVVKYVFYMQKTQLLAVITFVSALLHTGLSYTLIGKLGMSGAAIAFLASSFLAFMLTWRLSSRVYDMPWLAALRDVHGPETTGK